MIVRRVTKYGAEIGRYVEITRKTTSGYYARTLRKHFEFFLAENLNNFKKIEVVSIQTNRIEFEALKYAIHVHHELTPQWARILEKRPEIIKVRNCSDILYIWPSVIKKRIFNRTPCVYIEIKSREYE